MAKNRGVKTEDRYWDAREREMKNLLQQEKFLKRYDKNVKEIYRRMLYDAQKEIESFYGRYASKEGITINEAKKRVSSMDVEAFSKMAKRMVETKDFSPQANAALRLYNLTMKVNRLELLKARIGLRLADGFDEIDKLTEMLLENAGLDEFKRQAGILGESVINPEQKAEAIANSSFQNANFSDRIWMYQDQLRNEIANDLRSGLIQGKNSQEMARKLRRRFGVSMYNASRLARTEMARVQTEAQMQSFERNGYTHYVFIARESACDHCAPLDGKIFAVKDMRPGVNAPPIHPHCFCSSAAATEEQIKTVVSNLLIPRTLSAAGKNYPIQLSNSKQHTKFIEGQQIQGHVFAGAGTSVLIRDRFRLESTYHIPADEWKKVSAIAMIVGEDKRPVKAEVHWYEAKDEKVEMKVKRYFDDEGSVQK